MDITKSGEVNLNIQNTQRQIKILVIRFSSIGDIVLTSPVIRCLKNQVPNAEVHFLSKGAFKAVTEANPYIDKFFYFNGNLDAVIASLKEEQYNYVVDLHKNFRTFKIKRALKCKSFTYKKESLSKFLLTKLHINTMSGRHITERSLDAVVPLGVTNDGMGLDYFIPKHVTVAQDDLPTQHQFGYVAIVIGASYYTKKLPVEKLQELCTSIDYPIVLIGGVEDQEEGNEIAKIAPFKIYNACGKFSLHESAWLVKKAKLVISHDTGLQYIASAFNKKVLAIWGGTSPKLDVEPYYGEQYLGSAMHQNFIVPGLSCQPCSNFGTKTCPKGHFKCMKDQDVLKIGAIAMRMVVGDTIVN
ncbi:glycosyltransferase family 9 protein [Parasediminibacterium sp. JCM 36343]|uniref:glycosyltransferase family 9 protein n=1 Tax=Parasediminibacterium sp. JCM 36343 TaxID=3374279 RepID=UPI00397B7141